jgi:hypothetical protein
MATYTSKLENLLIPVILPKKGKGERRVNAKFNISTSSFIESELFIKYFLTLSNSVLSVDSLEKIAKSIIKDFSIQTVEIFVEFELPLERLSQLDFVETVYYYKCGYRLYLCKKNKNSDKYIWLNMPIIVNDIIPTYGYLNISLGYKGVTPYFEDIVFNIEKQTVPFNAALTLDEKQNMKEKFSISKNDYTILSDLLDIYENSSYITSCVLEINHPACSLRTNVSYVVESKKK